MQVDFTELQERVTVRSIGIIQNLLITIYNTVIFPQELLLSTFITVPNILLFYFIRHKRMVSSY